MKNVNLSRFSQLLFSAGTAHSPAGVVLGVVRCRRSFGDVSVRIEFRPDRLPVVGAQHLPSHEAIGCLLNGGAVFDWYAPSFQHPLMDGTLGDAEDVGERFVAANMLSGNFDRVFVHFGVWS